MYVILQHTKSAQYTKCLWRSTMIEQTFVIQGRLPTLNEYINANRTPLKNHKGTMGSIMKKDTDNLCAMFIKASKIKPVTSPQFIEFEWHFNTRHDFDNIAFAKKFILDALQKCKVLKNDNQKYVVGFSDRFIKDKKSFVIVKLKGAHNDTMR